MKHEAQVFEIAPQWKLKLGVDKEIKSLKSMLTVRSDFQTTVTVMIFCVITC